MNQEEPSRNKNKTLDEEERLKDRKEKA